MSKNNLAGTLAFVLAVLSVTIMFWLGGYNFNERGFAATGWFVLCLFMGGLAFTLAAIEVDDE